MRLAVLLLALACLGCGMYQPARNGYPGLVKVMDVGSQAFCINSPGPTHPTLHHRCDCWEVAWRDGGSTRVWVTCG